MNSLLGKYEACSEKNSRSVQKQPPEVFYVKKLQASGLQLYQKRDSGTGVFL